MSLAIAPTERYGVPLKIMCSITWHMPASGFVSIAERAQTKTLNEMTGAEWFSFKRIFMPFGSVCFIICISLI